MGNRLIGMVYSIASRLLEINRFMVILQIDDANSFLQIES